MPIISSLGTRLNQAFGKLAPTQCRNPESLTQDVRPQQALNENVGEEFPIFQNGGAKKWVEGTCITSNAHCCTRSTHLFGVETGWKKFGGVVCCGKAPVRALVGCHGLSLMIINARRERERERKKKGLHTPHQQECCTITVVETLYFIRH